jgi:hypothetical protein
LLPPRLWLDGDPGIGLVAVAHPGSAQVNGDQPDDDPNADSGPRSSDGAAIALEEPAHWMEPSDPQVGVSYPFDLLTHCGMSTTRFGGRYWQAMTPRAEPSRRSGRDGIVSYDGSTAGTMTLLSGDLLRFVITDPQVAGDGDRVDFTPQPATAAPPRPCA